MIAVRYVALIALVIWLGAMASEFVPQDQRLAYACGGVILVCLFAMKFVGPPPHGFIPRVALVAAMLAIAISSSLSLTRASVAAFTTVNMALGLVLLFWYVRE